MAPEPIFSHRCAVPAPLRISPKPAGAAYPGRAHQATSSSSPDPRSAAAAAPCTLRSRLPGQPVFDPAEGFSPEGQSLRAPNTKCSCPKSPVSPVFVPSPLSPRQSFLLGGGRRGSGSTTSTAGSRGPSLDFSSLFMRSETLRHELETCSCHHRGEDAARLPAGPPPPVSAAGPDPGHSRWRDSSSSGYTSCYSN